MADELYAGGGTWVTNHSIGNTIDDPLYQASRHAYSGSMSYAIPVMNGNYQVVLKFAEPYWEGVGKRVFDVLVEGAVVADDLDVVRAVGRDMAYDLTVDCAVTDSVIDITFASVNRDPMLSAILVLMDGYDVPLRDADAPLGGSTHLAVDYYELSSPTALPDFSALTPYAQETVAEINFPSTDGVFATSGRSDDVGAVFTGYFEAPLSGQYTFHLASDDGSELSIGDTVVIDNDGLHGMDMRSGSIGLKAGMHEMRLAYFEAGGGAGLVLSVDSPVDADGDGMSDTWEFIYNVDDPDADPDGDGVSNLDESIAGTDPNNPPGPPPPPPPGGAMVMMMPGRRVRAMMISVAARSARLPGWVVNRASPRSCFSQQRWQRSCVVGPCRGVEALEILRCRSRGLFRAVPGTATMNRLAVLIAAVSRIPNTNTPPEYPLFAHPPPSAC